jgi:hypothetical protein
MQNGLTLSLPNILSGAVPLPPHAVTVGAADAGPSVPDGDGLIEVIHVTDMAAAVVGAALIGLSSGVVIKQQWPIFQQKRLVLQQQRFLLTAIYSGRLLCVISKLGLRTFIRSCLFATKPPCKQ